MSRHWAKYLFGLIAILYPLLVFCTLVIFKLPIRYFSIGLIIFAIAYSVINSHHYKGKKTAGLFITPLILCAIGAVSLFMEDSPFFIKLYPALADLAFLTIWVTSFFFPPPLAYYFIDIFDKSMKTVIPQKRFELYCFRATLVWCVYFIADGIIAVLTVTVYYHLEFIWIIYNAVITYIIMGLIFAGEYIILKLKLKKYSRKLAETEVQTEVSKDGVNVNS